jgi:osmotically inducible lipoprotein OsmB
VQHNFGVDERRDRDAGNLHRQAPFGRVKLSISGDIPMRKTLGFLAAAATVLTLAACGHTTEQRAASGAIAGAVVGGPVGAAAGGAVGTAVSKTVDKPK